ncbi:MAG: histidine kinase [Acidobacteriia bacterium]|nr:histidine kinase [Terriglobia bacterium]
MHPILAQRRRLALYLAAWLPVVGLIVVLLDLSGRLSWAESLALAIPMGLLNAFLCLAAWYLCRTFPLGETGILRLFAIYAIASLLTSSLWVFIGKGVAATLAGLPRLTELNSHYTQQVPLLFGVGILLFLLVVAVHYLLSSFESSRQTERRALELQILAREAELKSLRAQIDPHFLFNCLNSISALTTLDPAKARQMCLLLADFLRMSLELGSRDFISLDEEISLACQFLAVEQVRLGPRLVVDKRIQESSRSCVTPPLLLQPLVENAVRHGIAQLLEGGPVRIEAETRGNRLRLTVANPYDPEAAPGGGKGIGLKNVRRRLMTLFGTEARMDLQKDDNMFRVEISFPARVKETESQSAEARS